MRCAVVLGEGKYADELKGFSDEAGPRLEFVEIAKATDAHILSYTSAAAERGGWYRTLFRRYSKVGSALNVGLLARDYDRIYITAEGIGLPLALLLKARRWKGKIVCVFHNMSWQSKKLALRVIGHEIFAALITVSERQARILTDECGMPSEKVLSVFNWVDDKFFAPHEVESPPCSFFMACGAENRDYDTLARAAGQVSGHFAVYGHGFRADNIAAKVRPANMEFMPRVSYSELRDAYAGSSIVVVPLNDVDYAAGVSGLVEAMASGRPVVATASKGIEEYLIHFEPGTTVPAGDDAAIAKVLVQLMQDEPLRERLGHRNRLFAQSKCSVDTYARLIRDRMHAA